MLHAEQTAVLWIWRAASGLWELQGTVADVRGDIQEEQGCKLSVSAQGVSFASVLSTQPRLDPKFLLRVQVSSSPCAVRDRGAISGARGQCKAGTLPVPHING